ncbi:MAG: hypothetical protein KDB27_33625 [Planctomycetales bacterium]|nr:hypothetical protein [Planctomycetales bacterium]
MRPNRRRFTITMANGTMETLNDSQLRHPNEQAATSRPVLMRRIALSALVFFLMVFAVGFVLGVIRVTWVQPRVGTRAAELLEMPLMLIAIVIASESLVRSGPRRRFVEWLTVGLFGLGLLVMAEAILVLGLRGMSLREYVANRDPISGTVYAIMLLVYAAFPAFSSVCRR